MTFGIAIAASIAFGMIAATFFVVVVSRPRASSGASEATDNRPVIGIWYDPYDPAVAAYFTGRELERGCVMPHPGELIPGREGKEWGMIRGNLPAVNEHQVVS